MCVWGGKATRASSHGPQGEAAPQPAPRRPKRSPRAAASPAERGGRQKGLVSALSGELKQAVAADRFEGRMKETGRAPGRQRRGPSAWG
jgi:hypothetical protein